MKRLIKTKLGGAICLALAVLMLLGGAGEALAATHPGQSAARTADPFSAMYDAEPELLAGLARLAPMRAEPDEEETAAIRAEVYVDRFIVRYNPSNDG